MKKHENSSVCIKEVMFTALFLLVASFGGLNVYRVGYEEKANPISVIESANIGEDSFESALVENTEDDVVYSENIKFLATVMIGDASGDISELTEKGVSTYQEKVASRGNFVREQVANEISLNTQNDTNEVNNKLLSTVLNEIKELGEKQEELLLKEEISLNKMDEIEEKQTNYENVTEVTNTVVKNELTKEDSFDTQESVVILEENLIPPTEYVKTIDVKATAYCLCKKCCGKSPSHPAYGVTASGLKIIPETGMKVVASDPNVIPLGTKVYIEGLYGAKDYGYAIVADTGSAIKNYKIDLYMDTHQMALNWGVKSVRVYILEK